MKTALATIMVTIMGVSPLAAQAPAAQAEPVSVSMDELPLTARFAGLLTSYRNCVLKQVDQIALGQQQDMAREAMSACALSRGELHGQLLADLQAKQPMLSPAVAQTVVENGLDQLDPMIEATAVDWAHMRYARTMF